jgi:hypothetical protein
MAEISWQNQIKGKSFFAVMPVAAHVSTAAAGTVSAEGKIRHGMKFHRWRSGAIPAAVFVLNAAEYFAGH